MTTRGHTDVHNGLTGLAVLALVAIRNAWENPTARMWLALHGTIGLLRVWKSRIFRDKSWERQASLGYGLVIWFGLTLYWIALWLITSGGVQAPFGLVATAISLCVIGVFVHFATDMQECTALTLLPEHLITTGMMARRGT